MNDAQDTKYHYYELRYYQRNTYFFIRTFIGTTVNKEFKLCTQFEAQAFFPGMKVISTVVKAADRAFCLTVDVARDAAVDVA